MFLNFHGPCSYTTEKVGLCQMKKNHLRATWGHTAMTIFSIALQPDTNEKGPVHCAEYLFTSPQPCLPLVDQAE